MKLEVIRFSSQNDSTLGLLFDVTHGRKFLCFTLEDEARDTKVMGETRIPAGIYDLKLRTEGGYHNRFLKKFGPAFHKGMIWVQNVPNFKVQSVLPESKFDPNSNGVVLFQHLLFFRLYFLVVEEIHAIEIFVILFFG